MPRKSTATRKRNRHGAEGAVWRRIVTWVVNRDKGICHICTHAGATTADHLISVTERPDLALTHTNLKAAHAYPHACPVCSEAAERRGGKPVYCNEIKQGYSLERARRLIEERTGLSLAAVTGAPEEALDWLECDRRKGRYRDWHGLTVHEDRLDAAERSELHLAPLAGAVDIDRELADDGIACSPRRAVW